MISGSIIAGQQMKYLQNKNLGFDKDNLLVVKQSQNLNDNYQAFINELEALAGDDVVKRVGRAVHRRRRNALIAPRRDRVPGNCVHLCEESAV